MFIISIMKYVDHLWFDGVAQVDVVNIIRERKEVNQKMLDGYEVWRELIFGSKDEKMSVIIKI